MCGVKTVVAPVQISSGGNAGMQTFVPTAQLEEIYADKIFALVARNYLKPRDIFDLYWLGRQGIKLTMTDHEMGVRLATYPNESPAAWLKKADIRRKDIMGGGSIIKNDLKRWLPSSWNLTDGIVNQMINTSLDALELGVSIMQEISGDLNTENLLGPMP